MSDLIPLAQAHCIPRRGSEHRLAAARVRELLPEIPGWELAEEGKALLRTFEFADYYRTISFVNALAHTASKKLYGNLKYDPVTSFTPIGSIGAIS